MYRQGRLYAWRKRTVNVCVTVYGTMSGSSQAQSPITFLGGVTWNSGSSGTSHPFGFPFLCPLPQVKMQKGERQMAKRFLEERKEELEEVAHELAETEHENTVLRHNIERIKEEKDFTM